ncbi:polypeptide deformylase [Legionella geestiana]|uniref:Peptide deformylase-like n=1 Tax=Legionella geestiana TaxID=45065 RepID=A0A0W0TY81_9GAMM|nr:peptide deformylase [Legionella geestiana]KTD00691.1 polypeptide deformylase [Legionella geestiana]QBS11697.1 peptide deformylase [Legionella geestiana]QDQ40692.1 peptide deformylase [Legionella geestiana]STX53616.1 polypeptide deformylase [Legionella geestiana]
MKKMNNKYPIFKEIAKPVIETEFGSKEQKNLIDDLFKNMEENAAVCSAAPQIGIGKGVKVFDTIYTNSRKQKKLIQNAALINPKFKILSDEIKIDYEGCLNCDIFLMGQVPRAMEIEYCGFDTEGNPITKNSSGLEARIIQHEIGNLNGYLFIDRMGDDSALTALSEPQEKG